MGCRVTSTPSAPGKDGNFAATIEAETAGAGAVGRCSEKRGPACVCHVGGRAGSRPDSDCSKTPLF
jgi:hypothetical protein